MIIIITVDRVHKHTHTHVPSTDETKTHWHSDSPTSAVEQPLPLSQAHTHTQKTNTTRHLLANNSLKWAHTHWCTYITSPYTHAHKHTERHTQFTHNWKTDVSQDGVRTGLYSSWTKVIGQKAKCPSHRVRQTQGYHHLPIQLFSWLYCWQGQC